MMKILCGLSGITKHHGEICGQAAGENLQTYQLQVRRSCHFHGVDLKHNNNTEINNDV